MSTDGGLDTAGAPTLEDVARAAGVSRATVSRVVNGGALVSARSRESVERAIRALGYAPNIAARSLVTRRSGVVGVLVPESDDRVFSDPFFAQSYRGALAAFADDQTHVMLAMAKAGEAPEGLLDFVVSGRVDAAIVVSHHGTDLPRAVAAGSAPVVFLGDPGVPGLPYVDLDQLAGARLATERLLARGCRRVATITGPMDMPAGQQRHHGFLETIRAAGLEPAGVVHADFTLEGGRLATDELLARCPRLDGMFVASDLMAVGALQALAQAGRRVPGDVAVVGFDDAEIARQTVPALTTMTNPAHELARLAGVMVRELLAGHRPTSPVIVTSELVARDSA